MLTSNEAEEPPAIQMIALKSMEMEETMAGLHVMTETSLLIVMAETGMEISYQGISVMQALPSIRTDAGQNEVMGSEFVLKHVMMETKIPGMAVQMPE